MRKRYQKGSLKKVKGTWIAQWWEDGHRRNKSLGRVSKMTKAEAQEALAGIIGPVNGRMQIPAGPVNFEDFLNKTYLPFYLRRWKASTASTTTDRIRYHLTSELESKKLESFTRDELQDLLDRKAAEGLSFSTVDHLRWDLKQIFELAVNEGRLRKNPAALLFTPRGVAHAKKPRMNREEVKSLFSALGILEKLIAMLAILAGMRAGEIFALKWADVHDDYLDVKQRLYRGLIDSPKTHQSERRVALSDGLQLQLSLWRVTSSDWSPDAWVFPSETGKTPLAKDNCWRRKFLPKLQEAGLDWVNFQVMRRTHSSLMRELGVDPKLVADQLGHTLDVNLNVYTETDLGQKREAVNSLEKAIQIS